MLTLIQVTDAYKNKILAAVASPELLTPPQAAKQIGVSTVMVSKTARKLGLIPYIVAGTEKNHYPVYVHTPEQVATIAEALAEKKAKGK